MIFEEISDNTFDGLLVREHSEYNHEKVYYYEDPNVSLKSLVAIHSTKYGPAIGGCRFKNYDNFLDGLNDVLRLSRGMTEKNIAADVPFGGGKAIIFANGINKSHDLLKSFANFLNHNFLPEEIQYNSPDFPFFKIIFIPSITSST